MGHASLVLCPDLQPSLWNERSTLAQAFEIWAAVFLLFSAFWLLQLQVRKYPLCVQGTQKTTQPVGRKKLTFRIMKKKKRKNQEGFGELERNGWQVSTIRTTGEVGARMKATGKWEEMWWPTWGSPLLLALLKSYIKSSVWSNVFWFVIQRPLGNSKIFINSWGPDNWAGRLYENRCKYRHTYFLTRSPSTNNDSI